MSNPRRTLTFYFDYISHNAYLAWTQLPALAARHNLEMEIAPVLFAGLLNAHGQLGPAEVPAKARWMGRDVIRKAKRLGVPLSAPANHPFNPLLPLRASARSICGDAQPRLVAALWEATWVRAQRVAEADVVAAAAEEAGLDGSDLVVRAQSAEAKRELRERTDAAVEAGVFGIPTLVVEGELFWGYDDFAHLEVFLRGEDPLRPEDIEPWARLQPSSRRTRPEER